MLALALNLSFFQKAALLNTKTSKPKKTIQRKKHLRVINILKKSIGAITINKCIQNLRLNLTIDKLLASTLVFEKQLIKAITKNEAI